jgi:hypothetical protein
MGDHAAAMIVLDHGELFAHAEGAGILSAPDATIHDFVGREVSAFAKSVLGLVLRLVDGEEQPWGDTIWIMNRLNELRVRTGHPQMRHDNVMKAVRKAMESLGPEINLRNFVEIENGYVDVRGRAQ